MRLIQEANEEVLQKILEAQPFLMDVVPASRKVWGNR